MRNRDIIIGIFAIISFVLYSCSEHKSFSVTVHGGSEQLSGSMTLIERGSQKILIDCGSYYPEGNDLSFESRKTEAIKLSLSFPFDPSDIDAVFLTHAHLDHTGRVPLLVKQGFRGKIYCSSGTLPILREMIFMAIRYGQEDREWCFSSKSIRPGFDGKNFVTAHWADCEFEHKIKSSNRKVFNGSREEGEKMFGCSFNPCKACATIKLNTILKLIESVDYNMKIKLYDGMAIEFFEAGHIPGAASIAISLTETNDKNAKYIFSGDLGNDLSHIQSGPNPAPEATALWIESTYGGIVRDSNLIDQIIEFQHEIASAVSNGDVVWIPSYALDRTQKVLFEINEAIQKGILSSNVPIFCPSPTADRLTKLYNNEQKDNKNHWFRPDIYRNVKIFPPYQIELPDNIPHPSILITTGGMMDMGYSLSLLDKIIPDENAQIFLVGYQDPFSPGGQLKEKKGEIEFDGRSIPVRAKIHNYNVFSAHADANDIENWLKNQEKNSVKIFLIHGDRARLDSQKNYLKKVGFMNVEIAKKGLNYKF